jgi:hypothetical protein
MSDVGCELRVVGLTLTISPDSHPGFRKGYQYDVPFNHSCGDDQDLKEHPPTEDRIIDGIR